MPVLSLLVGDVAAFETKHWGRRPLHVPAHGSRPELASLLTVDDVDTIVSSSARLPAARMVAGGQNRAPADYCAPTRIGSKTLDDVVDVDKVRATFRSGSTLVLQSLHRTWDPVSAFAAALEDEITHRVQANAYLSPPRSVGLAPHADGHDVFVVQTHGTKQWHVDEHDPLTLEPGDVLYLPRGCTHSAGTDAAVSLHLTLGVHPTTYGTVMESMVRATDAAKRPLPLGFAHIDADELERLVRRHVDEIRAELDTPDPTETDADTRLIERLRSRRPRRHARGALADAIRHAEITDDTVIARADHEGAWEIDDVDGAQVRLVTDTDQLTCPAFVRPALEQVGQLARLRVGDLSGLDGPGRLVLARRLLDDGFAQIVGGTST